MEDKKLIDNESATTVENFYGNQGGKDVQIPLATAASVLAGQMSILCVDVEVQAGASYTIPNSNVKALVLLSFRGTSIAVASFWNRTSLAATIHTHTYITQGELAEGAICLTKDGSGNFVLTNNRSASAVVNCRLIYID